jgi:membrane protein implicated in regulation of membrane protease activity
MDLTFHAWHLWLVAAIGAAALELHLGNFVLIWFAVGAVVGAVTSGLGGSLDTQLLVFLASSVALFASSRTLFRRWIAPKRDPIRYGDSALVGEEAIVTEPLEPSGGAVRIHGELWSARSIEGTISAGERVQIERVDGLKLYVRRSRAPVWSPLPEKETQR